MNIFKFCPPFFAAAALVFAPLPVSARDSAGKNSTIPNLDLARQLNQTFVQIAEDVSPAVVVITVTQKPSASQRYDYDSNGNDDQDPGDDTPPSRRRYHQRSDQQPVEKAVGQGSGIIIRTNGFILTNRHVVEDAEKIEVRLKDGRTFNAEVRGMDAPADVAVIKIDAQDLPVARLADSSKTRVGEFAIAIGAPFALDYSVTFGHVSAKDRSNIGLDSEDQSAGMMDQNFIQTDANINPGNSGGPLVNIEGEVIGINTLIRGLHTGIGFAIPINLAREVADKIITDGKFTRAWLGIVISSLREEPFLRDAFPGVKDGVIVQMIEPHAPVIKSDLRASDVITAVDGKPVVTSQQLKEEIRSKKVGQGIVLDISRHGEKLKITVKPGEYVDQSLANGGPDDSIPATPAGNLLGVHVQTLTRQLARRLEVQPGSGILVSAVDPNSLADQYSAIQKGDVITQINQQPVTNLKQFQEVLKTADAKAGIIVNYIHEGAARFDFLKEDSK